MGTWGTSIKSNDTYADVYGEFFALYNDGMDVKGISQNLTARYQETINDIDDSNNFWFALAKAQWECKQIEVTVLNKVKQIIETGADIEVWQRLVADEKSIDKRKIALNNFLQELLSERPKAKARKKKITRKPFFDKGDCLTFILANGNYGGAIVLEALYGAEYPYILVANTRLNQSNKPVKEDFINAEVLIANHAFWNNKPLIAWRFLKKKDIMVVEKVDTVDVWKSYDIKKHELDFYFGVGFDIVVINNQFRYELDEGLKSTKTMKIRDMI